ncbi:DNA mismatch repair protein MLH3 [Citrus sinensis]|uniref:DNA mismatch repair protein MLH3 n=1 Tax=Citrus sinensis TaxID=2711 RepID=A0ACB8IZ01_CITSI|nr:DNA mismatch repair protein MLH3 [Citrus sinensis]
MGTINRLPEAVRNMVRSGTVLFDLTRVVEELVFNSVDAGATKVFVYVGVCNCYVKVVDDGSGISRDGLVLLGERHATSKLGHLADMDDATGIGTFGFRGEALASISDVSLLEIITKAHGRPNGYRKVMKGSKCLYIGIDDERKDVGTTVVSRDLFYNQPVRRKYMQSSEDELLCTCSSSSPLALLISSFGIEDFSFLNEVNANDGALEISGYISSPYDSISVKDWEPVLAFIERAIRSAWMKKIAHDSFDVDMLEDAELPLESSRFQSHQSSTHLHSSPLKNLAKQHDHMFYKECERITFQEFQKDPVELAEENTEMEFFSQPKHSSSLLDGSFAECLPIVPPKIDHRVWTIESSWFQDHQPSRHLFSPPLENLKKEGDHLFRKECERITFGEAEKDPAELQEENTEMEYVPQPKYSFGLSDGSFAKCLPIVPWKIDRHAWTIESSRFQYHQSSPHLYSSPLENLSKEGDHLFREECERITFGEFEKHTPELKEENSKRELVSQPKYSSKLLDCSFAECLSPVLRKIDLHGWTSGNRFSLKGSYFLETCFLADGRSSIPVEGDLLNSQRGYEYLQIEPGVSNGASGTASPLDKDEFSNEFEVSKDIKKPLRLSCFSQGSPPLGGPLFSGGEERCESSTGCFKYKRKRKRVCYDKRMDILEADFSNQSFDSFSRTPLQDEASCSQHLPRLSTAGDITAGFDLMSRASLNLFPSHAEPFTKETNFLSDSIEPVGNSVSDYKALNSVWCSKISDPFPQGASWNDGHFIYNNALEGHSILGEGTSCGQLADTEENYKFDYDSKLRRSNQEKCTTARSGLRFEYYDNSSEDFCKYLQEHDPCNKFSREHSDVPFDKTDWLCSVLSSIEYDNPETQRYKFRNHNCEPNPIHKELSRRSHSAPPFHRHKRRYISLNCCSVEAGKSNAHTLHCAKNSPEAGAFKHLQQSSGVCNANVKPSSEEEDFRYGPRPDFKIESSTILDLEETHKAENFKLSLCPHAHLGAQAEGSQESMILMFVFQNNNISCDIHNQDNILDISSGLLHLTGEFFIPDSINKSCLEDAKVLQQVDKKFIPVVAGGTLAVIDQHAADERIRLEELRHKVLSGEGKSVAYLDAEQELVLPEIGYQLLQNFAEQIKDWGWICNIHTQGSRSFNKNLNLLQRQITVITLLAVPCIFGVNLSDVDLLEFLQQLADTDGSSTTPPSVLRVLNSKACRGAIMFGDSLLPSECALIVEELKQTSLCFQCAHGRPTTVPLVNLEALHKQIAQLNNSTLYVRNRHILSQAMCNNGGKKCWKLMTHPHFLVARILKARYYPRSSFADATVGYNPSYTWRSIMAAKQVVVKGSRIQIGSGQQVQINKDLWLPDADNGFITTVLDESLATATVNSIMVPGQRQWDTDLVANIFNTRDTALILQVPLSTRQDEDCRFWLADTKGKFTVRSCYNVLNSAPTGSNSKVWKFLWGLEVPGKVKHFIWCALVNVLPTADNLLSRKVDVSPICPICSAANESVYYCLVDCLFATSCWLLSSLGTGRRCPSFFDWIEQTFIKCRKEECNLAIMVCWKLWLNRNDKVWNGHNEHAQNLVIAAGHYLFQWQEAKRKNFIIVEQVQLGHGSMCWAKPPLGWFKCNVDAGVFSSQGRYSFGGVIRDYGGGFVAAKCQSFSGLFRPREAEALAVREALR